jgi:hypothetical protein
MHYTSAVSARDGSSALGRTLLVVSVLLGTVIIGMAIPILPRFLTVGLGLLLFVLPIYIFKPAWLIVPVALAAMYLPSNPMSDVLTVLFLVRAIPPLLARMDTLRQALQTTAGPALIAILGIAIVSLAVSSLLLNNGKSPIYQDGRAFVYWMWAPALIAFAPRPNAVRWVGNQIIAIGACVSILALLQGVLGISLFNVGRVDVLQTLGELNEGTVRVQIPGFVFVTFAAFLSLNRLLSSADENPKRMVHSLVFLLCSAGVIYNFGRALWFWFAVGLVITALANGGTRAFKAIGALALSATLLGSVITLARPTLKDAIVDRVVSVFREGGSRTSYGWRQAENANAMRTLQRTMLVGVGLGGEYRAPVLSLTGFENHTRYIHNAHLGLALKISVLGYLAYLTFFGALFVSAVRARRSLGVKDFASATIAWVPTALGQNITQPDIMTAYGVMLAAAVWAAHAAFPQPVAKRRRGER